MLGAFYTTNKRFLRSVFQVCKERVTKCSHGLAIEVVILKTFRKYHITLAGVFEAVKKVDIYLISKRVFTRVLTLVRFFRKSALSVKHARITQGNRTRVRLNKRVTHLKHA